MSPDKSLELDLNWMEDELALMKSEILSAPEGSIKRRTLLRAAIAMLYAHYEGFCKFAFQFYVDEVVSRQLPLRDLIDPIAMSIHSSELKKMRKLDDTRFWLGVREFSVVLDSIDYKSFEVTSSSNLYPNILDEICLCTGLILSKVDENRERLKSLVARRNEIAHGKNYVVSSVDEYNLIENCVMIVMHDVAYSVIDSIQDEKFRVAR
jgi:hypothetical protein